MTSMKYLSLFIVLFLAALQISLAVKYTVTNKAAHTKGGIRFNNVIGHDYVKDTIKSATLFIKNAFQQSSGENAGKNIDTVKVFIETFNSSVAFTVNNEIHISANYIETYSGGDLLVEITGVLYHEMTHVWQWNGNGNANGGLIEGIANYIRLKSGFAPSHWVVSGQGKRWDQGYDVTARFLDYFSSLDADFVAKLNKKMKNGYSEDFFVEILGESVDKLWIDYKIKFN